jgi:hypothetical protein
MPAMIPRFWRALAALPIPGGISASQCRSQGQSTGVSTVDWYRVVRPNEERQITRRATSLLPHRPEREGCLRHATTQPKLAALINAAHFTGIAA